MKFNIKKKIFITIEDLERNDLGELLIALNELKNPSETQLKLKEKFEEVYDKSK